MRCPVQGHEHEVVRVRTITQDRTGQRAGIYECPSGQYRWLVIDGHELSDLIRMKRPRWGWKETV